MARSLAPAAAALVVSPARKEWPPKAVAHRRSVVHVEALNRRKPLHRLGYLQGLVANVGRVQGAAELIRVVHESAEQLLEFLLDRDEDPQLLAVPADVHPRLVRRPLERI